MSHVMPTLAGRHDTHVMPATTEPAEPPTYESRLSRGYDVTFPAWRGERHYMIPFAAKDFQSGEKALPDEIVRYSRTIGQMLRGLDLSNCATGYAMIDEAYVLEGQHHRRCGLHIDGHWVHHLRTTAYEGGDLPVPDYPETLVMATNMLGSVAYVGEFEGEIGEGGDCAHIRTHEMEAVRLNPGITWIGNVSMLHETIPVVREGQRTFIRLNLPNVDF